MMINGFIFPIVSLFMGFIISSLFGINPLNFTDIILYIGAFFLSISLFANVQDIPKNFIREHKTQTIKIVTIGLIFKALALGGILYILTKEVRFFLIAALLSQIDPNFTNWAKQNNAEVSELNLIESTFDDPISTLITLYVALPFVLGEVFDLKTYFIMIFINLIFAQIFFILKEFQLNLKILSALSIIVGSIYNLFLGVALSGLIVRLEKNIYDKIIPIITYASYFLIGMYVPQTGLNVIVGGTVALILVFIVRPLEVTIFFGKSNIKKSLIYAEQKGITSLLLLLIIQPKVDILPIVLPAMIIINILFIILNTKITEIEVDKI